MKTRLRPKKCKAQGCGKTFKPERPFHDWCSDDCAIKLARERQDRAATKAKRAEEKARKQRVAKIREQHKTKPRLEKTCQTAFNAWIRFRDDDRGCPTCDRSIEEIEADPPFRGGAWDCGHVLTVGSAPSIRFYTLNAMRQCKKCNAGHKQGKGSRAPEINEMYEAAADERWGQGHHIRLKRKANQPALYSKNDIRRLTKLFRRKLRAVKKIREKRELTCWDLI